MRNTTTKMFNYVTGPDKVARSVGSASNTLEDTSNSLLTEINNPIESNFMTTKSFLNFKDSGVSSLKALAIIALSPSLNQYFGGNLLIPISMISCNESLLMSSSLMNNADNLFKVSTFVVSAECDFLFFGDGVTFEFLDFFADGELSPLGVSSRF
ncbi:hypothetical protein WICMUC_005698 [Wickerhamomyces mucosus]|uniref:Uncharacterized protein n=1 Tax=Wickerhamomyces mucosus TaxID=1378264 RepID=A0A9P8P7G3_9ASCO|nr:hypothetical protein WICMUC_005698 [Wickerhamomyces mucosus]